MWYSLKQGPAAHAIVMFPSQQTVFWSSERAASFLAAFSLLVVLAACADSNVEKDVFILTDKSINSSIDASGQSLLLVRSPEDRFLHSCLLHLPMFSRRLSVPVAASMACFDCLLPTAHNQILVARIDMLQTIPCSYCLVSVLHDHVFMQFF